MKNPNEPATFRLAAQCLNQLRHRVPQKTEYVKKSSIRTMKKKKKKEKETKRNFQLSNFSNPLLMILHPCRNKPHSSVRPYLQKETRIPEQRVVFNP
jgi:hypothetical protein